MSSDLDTMGPIDYLVVEFPTNRMTGEGLPILVDLVDHDVIRILDLLFIRRELDGSMVRLTTADLDGDGELDLTVFEGASAGLLDTGDLDQAATVLEPGNSAAILVYENRWAAPLAAALRRGGAQVVANGRIPIADIASALDDTGLDDTGLDDTGLDEAGGNGHPSNHVR